MKLSILVAEDDQQTNETLCLMISRKFPEAVVRSAANGRQGVEINREHPADIVITDINMPGVDGHQMIEAIKAIKDDTKFIVLTGYSDKVHLDRFSEIGLCAYILKPIEFKKLFEAIEKCAAEIEKP